MEDIEKKSSESYLAANNLVDNNLEYKTYSEASERQEFESVSNAGVENLETNTKKKEFKMTSGTENVTTPEIVEYLEILILMSSQNNIINLIQKKLIDKCKNQSHTKCEEKEIRDFRRCLDKEKSKLKCIIKRKIELQKKLLNPSKQDDKITTILEKDSINFKRDDINSKIQLCPKVDEDFKSFICCLMNQADISSHNDCEEALFDSILSLLEEKGFRPKHGVANTFIGKNFKRENRKYVNDLKLSEKSWQRLCKQLINQINISQEQLANDNSNLEYDRMKLQEELVLRDNKISDLENKFNCLQKELYDFTKENKFHGESSRCFVNKNKSMEALQNIQDNNIDLKLGIDDMQHIVQRLKTEIEDLKKQRVQTLRKSGKSDKLEKLETTYRILLSDYTVVDNNLNNIKENIETNNGSHEKVQSHKFGIETKVLKQKIYDMMEKQKNFKSNFIEQAEQLKEYQSKYQLANRTAEEQKSMLEKLEEQNKRIENQINLEIQNLKRKFGEKIQELAEIPKLIENERSKTSSASEEKEELEQKLSIICKDYQELKRKYEPKKEINGLQLEERYKKATVQLQSLKSVYGNLKKEQDDVNEKLQTISNETDIMRTEVAREITLIKEKAEYTKRSIVEYIRRIEKEIVYCQINATTSIEEREKIITKMRRQLSILSHSFDTVQREIRTLRTHIHKLSINV